MAMPGHHDVRRRRLFDALLGRGEARRPPWTGEAFLEGCTRCDACIVACPEGVLERGAGGYPELHFRHDGCTLCGRCAEACDAGLFDRTRSAFAWQAEILDHCLALSRIHCQSCQEACQWQAIRFPPERGRPPRPRFDPQACTGCGACLAVCPQEAIRLVVPEGESP